MRYAGNGRLQIPDDSGGRGLAEGHQPLASGDKSGDGLMQICKRDRVDRNREGRARRAERDAIVEVGLNDGTLQHPIDQVGEPASQFQTGLARLPGQFPGTQFGVERWQATDALPGSANEDCIQGSGFFQVRVQESLNPKRGHNFVPSQSLDSKRMRRAADG